MTAVSRDHDAARRRPERYPFCVLILDSDEAAAHSLVQQLRALGHEAHAADSHDKALHLCEKLLPHVVLVAVQPPLSAHRNLALNIRAALGLEETYLVAVTDYDRETNRPGSVAAGFDEHLWRPVGPKLLEALMAYLSLKLRAVESLRPEGGCATESGGGSQSGAAAQA